MTRLVVFMLSLQVVSAQEILATDQVTIRNIKISDKQSYIGRTHLNLYELKIWSIDSAWAVNIGTENGGINCFAFSTDEKLLAMGTYQGYVEIWDFKNKRRISQKKVHSAQVNDIKFAHSDSLLISVDAEGAIVLSTVKGIEQLSTHILKENVNAIEVLPGRNEFVTGDHYGDITIWRIHPLVKVRSWKAHNSYILDLALDPSGRWLFSASHDKLIKMWSLDAPDPVAIFKGNEKSIFSIDISADGKLLCSGGMDRVVRLWSVPTTTLLKTFKGHTDYVMVVRFLNNSIISGSRDFTVRSWHIPEKLTNK